MRGSKMLVLLITLVGVLVGVWLLLVAARQGDAAVVRAAMPLAGEPIMVTAPYPAAAATIPGQFLAKIHTEALGRLPTQAEWQDLVDRFAAAASCTETVRQVATEFYTGTEFMNLPYDRAARLLALFRGALNRELDGASYVTYTTAPWNARPWSAVVTDVLGTAEFATLAETICAITNPPLYVQAAYYWNPDYLPYAISTTVPVSCTDVFTGTTGEDLQALLERAAQMGTRTVYLPQKAVVWVTTTLTFPEILQITKTLTLATCGNPPSSQYALQGRIVRHPTFDENVPTIILRTGNTLHSVWVDGQHAQLGGVLAREAVNVRADNKALRSESGSPEAIIPTQVRDCRLSDALGGTQIRVPEGDWWPCTSVTVTNNLLTGYANGHYLDEFLRPRWADGISTACGYTTVADNQIVDPTDVGIVVFKCGWGCNQASVVRDNTVLNAGNSAYGAYGVDPITDSVASFDFGFSGTAIISNVLWTGPHAHIDIPLVVGTRAWFGGVANWYSNQALRPALRFNTTNDGSNPTQPQAVRCTSPILVSGAEDVILEGNDLHTRIARVMACPAPVAPATTLVLATYAAGTASFYPTPTVTFQDVPAVVVDHCIRATHCPYCTVFLPLIFKDYSGFGGEASFPRDPLQGYPPPGEFWGPSLPPPYPLP